MLFSPVASNRTRLLSSGLMFSAVDHKIVLRSQSVSLDTFIMGCKTNNQPWECLSCNCLLDMEQTLQIRSTSQMLSIL